MCGVDEFARAHPSGTDNGSSGGGRSFTNTSSIDALESPVHNINLINNWIQLFEENYGERTGNIRESYLVRSLYIFTPIDTDGYIQKYQTKTRSVRGDWFLDNMNSKLPPIKIWQLSKK